LDGWIPGHSDIPALRSLSPRRRSAHSAQGITVVGIDARPEPIEMTRNLKLTADLLVDASKISAEEAVEQIEKLKPKDYVGWRGADGEHERLGRGLFLSAPTCPLRTAHCVLLTVHYAQRVCKSDCDVH
jgi:hypothetical protein